MTAPAVRLEPVSLADKPALWDMMAPYLIEHADKVDPEREHGDPLQYDYFDVYWTEPERRPSWIVADGERAGFVLVNAWSPSGRGTQHSIGEFCVAPGARRGGLGREAVRLALASAPGLWELQVYRANAEGIAFWPRAIAAAGVQDWEVIERDDRVIHRFTVAASLGP